MRILVIEDEKDIAAAIEKVLKRDGYAVDLAANGSSALELIDINEYDLVILDLMLPDISGFEVLEKLRKNSQDTRVIIVSANHTTGDRVKGLDLGANDYVVKPFDFDELRARIRALLRRDFTSKLNVMVESGFEIDLSSKRVTYSSKELILTLKEFSIFSHLVQNKGKYINAEELYRHVWNEESNPFTEVMRVHIYSLRKKINEITGKNNVISTTKGLGYIFKGE
ncbi:response regulator transcription factor [Neobacillus sp. WH10]|uniref:response regulator transcription factor n=1 Tax=Neobacillus sp. WH10 TaxID=3047873 RepID=UPI0024C177DE|nr:response regulator transcription factor [Neobacillus sp. WH10]WHY79448.1 response regulator transcription factor [Neobacillus sp. WH10]